MNFDSAWDDFGVGYELTWYLLLNLVQFSAHSTKFLPWLYAIWFMLCIAILLTVLFSKNLMFLAEFCRTIIFLKQHLLWRKLIQIRNETAKLTEELGTGSAADTRCLSRISDPRIFISRIRILSLVSYCFPVFITEQGSWKSGQKGRRVLDLESR
jgi:hypothetical protein